jgi:hypothetical protein
VNLYCFEYNLWQNLIKNLLLITIIIKEITTMANPNLIRQIEYYLSEENLQND